MVPRHPAAASLLRFTDLAARFAVLRRRAA
jgi:hypothetical protein